jgi:uncharacterized protein (TIGR02246 family)
MITTLSAIVLLGALQAPATPIVSSSQAEVDVRKAVQAFYDAYNAHAFDKLAEFTTEDWTHITPSGIERRGRAEVLTALKQVHSTFLKGVTDTPEEIAVRFATADVGIVTVRSRTTTFTTPDGVTHENEGRIRTFVVVKRATRWLIMQDQNTVRGAR